MRRSVSALALAVVVPVIGLGLTAPAYADTTVVVKGIDQPNMRSVEGPAGVPTGLGSLKLYHRAAAPSTKYEHLLEATIPIGSLSTLTITYKSEVPVVVSQAWTYDRLNTGDERSSESLSAYTTLPVSTTWRTANLIRDERDWTIIPEQTTHPKTDVLKGNLATLVASYPHTTLGMLSISLSSKTVTGAAWFDALRYGPTGDVTTLAFDADPIPVVHASAADLTIAPGATTPLSGRVTHLDGTPFSGVPMDLWKQSWGNPTRYKVLTTPTAADGSFRAVVSPTVKTSYFWQVGDGTNRYYVSPWRTVFVAPTLTLRVADPTVASPTPSVFAGTASSVLVGGTLTLRRTTDNRSLGHVVVAPDGTFRLSQVLPRGTYYVVATSPAQHGMSAGRSAPVHVAIG
jgi:hypothetical protein